ncbi:undecaprenyl-diphosphate phosphatase [Stenotrophomonas mori]|uniref:Undecaprenyl-diphosphatase n=1 Tax=Stenotrophomonas mori TaxID=2871096 RepID=A0ABT0SKA9_9GAMM|nr:undecaprenyl-diphosphate phosphatase [Stenotrophomonas mori]MCL7715773.1 undecaprenyl-diphosphate phosphatase [Stenotrophomonas mori]
MSDPISALLLGILEGLTEFLPVSSTGHLLIAQRWLGARSDFFNIVIQAGAILAITLVFRQRLWSLATGLGQRDNRDYVLKLGAAFLVTALVGLPVRLAGWQLPETVTPVAWALLIGGVWMLVAERLAERLPDRDTVTWKVAIGVGLAQVVAGVFPGTSRSAAAIFLAMLLGLSRRAAATEFVFLVGIPTMFAASAYAFLELARDGQLGDQAWGDVGLAFAAAVVTGFVVVKWLLGYIKHHRFTGFAVYRLALGAALLLFLPAGN